MQTERSAIDAAVLAEGGKTLWLDLRSCRDEARIISKLFESQEFARWVDSDYRLHLFLDSLDECLLRVDTVAALLVDELRDYPIDRLSLRIGCRTAEWPTNLLENDLRKLWGDEGFGAYELAPLRRTDVTIAAATKGIDPKAFLEAVHEAGAVPLAIKPVTLDFLMGSYHATGAFPTRQADLYLDGCRWLCEERNSNRVTSRRTGELSPDQRLAVAARIAAVTVFSNKYAVWNGIQQPSPEKEDMLVRTLAGAVEFVGEDEFPVGEDAIREVVGTGLFSARGPERLGWAHQTYAEFLAAYYLVQKNVSIEKAMSLIVHPDDEKGRLVPQLHETAAWLASISSEVFQALMEADPEVLIRSDVLNANVEDKVALVGTLLRLYDGDHRPDDEWALRQQYKKLDYPGIAEQLRPYIVDNDKNLSVRRIALDIAEACGLRELQNDAIRVALDVDEELLVRKEAANFVAHVGDSATRAHLMPLALGAVGEDPDDDLKGKGLHAIWPEHAGAEELFAMLTLPKKHNYRGSYVSFLTYDLTNHLRTSDLPAALAWVESRDSDKEEPFRFGELADQIMQRAWAELPKSGVAPAFARAALARLRCHEEIIKERKEIFEPIGELTFSQRVAADDYRRRLLLEELFVLLESEDDTYLLVNWGTPLVTKEDVGWLVESLGSEASEDKKSILAALVGHTYHLWNDEIYEQMYVAQVDDSTLARWVNRIFAPIKLGSEEAEFQRRHYERIRWREKEDKDEALPDPPVAYRVRSALDDFEGGDIEAFWAGVYHFMQCEEDGSGWLSGAEWDMTTLPGWEAADDGTKIRIVEAAKRYVLDGDPQTDEWFCKDVDYLPAFAGYRALHLLLKLAPDFVAELPAKTWKKWTPIILDFPLILNTDEEKEPHVRLVAMAYGRVPDTLLSVLLALIDYEDSVKGQVSVTRRLESCWDDRLAYAVLEKLKDPALKPRAHGVLLGDLLDYGLREARAFAESLIASVPRDNEKQVELVSVVAGILFFFAEDSGWNALWPAMRRDDDFADAVVDEVSSGARHGDLPYKHLTESEIADLYIWLSRRYSHSEYFVDFSNGMVTYGRRENIAEWRDDAIRHLQNYGTFEACRQIERIIVELPESQDRLKWTLPYARAEARRRTWVAPEPRHVLGIVLTRDARLVQNGEQLLEVVLESLHRLEMKLQGKQQGGTPAAPDLWSKHDAGTYRPMDEEAFSNYVKRHLHDDLEGRGIIVNREVVISRGEGASRGERTDVQVDAVVRDSRVEEHKTVTIIVEAKGCWHRRLYKEMEVQLANRYLRNNGFKYGLYLVGWFNCPQWDLQDSRQKTAARRNMVETQKRLETRASELSEGDLHIRAVILNTALR
jgi:predicted NACHT family NTPase